MSSDEEARDEKLANIRSEWVRLMKLAQGTSERMRHVSVYYALVLLISDTTQRYKGGRVSLGGEEVRGRDIDRLSIQRVSHYQW